MQARIIQVLGGISFFLGILFLFNASGVITGFAIAESIAPSISSIISLVLIVAGIGLVSYGELIAHGTRISASFPISSFFILRQKKKEDMGNEAEILIGMR